MADVGRMTGERYHNRASEFAAAVRASSPEKHRGSFAKCYDTAIDRAMRRLGLARFNRVPPFSNWRVGHCRPRPWAARMLANQLRENIRHDAELADALEKEIGPGSPGAAGAAALKRWRARRATR